MRRAGWARGLGTISVPLRIKGLPWHPRGVLVSCKGLCSWWTLLPVNRMPHLLRGHFPTDPKQPRTPGGGVLRGGSCHTLSSLVLFICTRAQPWQVCCLGFHDQGIRNSESGKGRGLSWTDMLSLASRNAWQPEGEEGEMMERK